MGELSQRLLVSNGNVTAIVQQLVKHGLVEVRAAENDRRTSIVCATEVGRKRFAELAEAHRVWIEGMFSAVPLATRTKLHALPAEVKRSLEAEEEEA